MKIDVSTIEGFDAMSAEEKLNAVLGIEIPDQDEIAKLKNQISKANSEAADWKKKHNALLSDEERKASENADALQALQTELETLRKEKAVSGFQTKLLENGFLSEEASKGASLLADGDIDGFLAIHAVNRKNLEKNIKAELLKQNPVPEKVGGTDSVMTKEKYQKLSTHEKMQFMNEHPEEYTEMMRR